MAINFRGAQFVGEFGEITGYKSGLALTEDRFEEIFAAGGYKDFWPTHPDAWLRIRSEKLEEIFAFTLAQLGVGPTVHVINPLGFVYHRLNNDPEKRCSFRPLLDPVRVSLDAWRYRSRCFESSADGMGKERGPRRRRAYSVRRCRRWWRPATRRCFRRCPSSPFLMLPNGSPARILVTIPWRYSSDSMTFPPSVRGQRSRALSRLPESRFLPY